MIMTNHAYVRHKQRGLRVDAIRAAIDFGQDIYQRGGSIAYHLSRRAVERAKKLGFDLHPYLNTVVVTGRDGVIITVYKSPDIKHLRTKSGFYHHKAKLAA